MEDTTTVAAPAEEVITTGAESEVTDHTATDTSAEPGAEEVQQDDPISGADGQEDDPDRQEETQESQEDGRRIPQWMRDLKTANPKAYEQAKTNLFDLNARRGVHPTVQLAREEHSLVQSIGGAEGIAKLQEDTQFLSDVSGKFMNGDPEFAKSLFDDDAVAAGLHVQPMLEHFQKANPEGYNSLITRLWDSEFKASGLSDALPRLKSLIAAGSKDDAVKLLGDIMSWKDSISDIATRAEDPRVRTLLQQRQKDREDRESASHQDFVKGYNTDVFNEVGNTTASTVDSFFKGVKLDTDQRTTLIKETVSRVNARLLKDKGFQTQKDNHLKRGNASAAKQLVMSRFKAELPTAVKQVLRLYGMVSGKSLTTQQPKQDDTARPAGNTTPADKGYVKVNARPTDLDPYRTTSDDIFSKRGVRRNGQKVTWAHLA